MAKFWEKSSLTFYVSHFKVDANGGEESLMEDVVAEPEEDVGLPDWGISDYQQFQDEVYVLWYHFFISTPLDL